MKFDHLHRPSLSDGMVSIADECGGSWWAALHGVVQAINCPPCREHGQRLMSAMHDLVNHKLGRPLFDPNNFARVAGEYAEAAGAAAKAELWAAAGGRDQETVEILEALAPQGKRRLACSPEDAAKVERCIEKLKGDRNPWASCQAFVKCAIPRVLELTHKDPKTGETDVSVIATNPTMADWIAEALAGETAG